jgi:hypothetical protein
MHCTSKKWHLFDAEGRAGVINLAHDFQNIFEAHLEVLRKIHKSREYFQISRVAPSSTWIYFGCTAECLTVGLNVRRDDKNINLH